MNNLSLLLILLIIINLDAQVTPHSKPIPQQTQQQQQPQPYKMIFITEPPDPQEPFLGMPQGIQLKKMVRALCIQDPLTCQEQKMIYSEWCKLDQEWCKDQTQTEALYYKLCPMYPQLCIPDPAGANPNHPIGIVLDELIRQICQKDPHLCYSLRGKYEEYCLDDPRWCVLDTQDYAIFLFYCKLNNKFCSQASIQKVELKLMYDMMKKELKQLCVKHKQTCKDIKKQQVKLCPKNKLYCGNPNRILLTYVQLCTKNKKFCHVEVLTWANEQHALLFL